MKCKTPMQVAVSEILREKEIEERLSFVAERVEEKLNQVAVSTLEKLAEMNPEVAKELKPQIPPLQSLKWKDIFKNVTVIDDQGISINKRGSGVKRLILLNFFRAEAERKLGESENPSIIYAIEEPETSQHPEYQIKLIEALIALSKSENTQVLITTHSPSIVKMMEFNQIKLVIDGDEKEIVNVEKNNLPYPSLNEVNFLAFDESCLEYHNELYGYIESEGKLIDFKTGKQTVNYIKVLKDGTKKTEQVVRSEFIRHQIHHPENKENAKFTEAELFKSIQDMRTFIKDYI